MVYRTRDRPPKAPGTVTEIKEFEGPHLLSAADGWEEVADYALSWATRLDPAILGARAVSGR